MKSHHHSISTRTFTASEVEKVTGVSATLQREWRRRGVLPEKGDKSWTRTTAEQLVTISVIKFLADAGMGLRPARVAAEAAAPLVLEWLLILPGATAVCKQAQRFHQPPQTEDDAFYITTLFKDGSWYGQRVPGSHGATSPEPTRFLAFDPDFHLQPDVSHIVALSKLGEDQLPSNMIVTTMLDVHRSARTILERSDPPLIVVPER